MNVNWCNLKIFLEHIPVLLQFTFSLELTWTWFDPSSIVYCVFSLGIVVVSFSLMLQKLELKDWFSAYVSFLKLIWPPKLDATRENKVFAKKKYCVYEKKRNFYPASFGKMTQDSFAFCFDKFVFSTSFEYFALPYSQNKLLPYYIISHS